jgi:hypothetical protein
MDDVRRRDLQVWGEELLSPFRLFVALIVAIGGIPLFQSNYFLLSGFWILVLGSHALAGYSASIARRFRNPKMRALWTGCEERLARFEEALKRMRSNQIADLQEMPATIRNVAKSLYAALRRADLISYEVEQSERGLYDSPPVTPSPHRDAQSTELYRIAEKNLAEYRQQYMAVMSGVRRTEAHAAVFMTTVDTLRMKMIGYRLVGKSPAMASDEFLSVLAEARAQLQSIDVALEELDLSHYPKTISVVPDPHEDNVSA